MQAIHLQFPVNRVSGSNTWGNAHCVKLNSSTNTALSKIPARTILWRKKPLSAFTIPVEFLSLSAVTNVVVSKTQITETQTRDLENSDLGRRKQTARKRTSANSQIWSKILQVQLIQRKSGSIKPSRTRNSVLLNFLVGWRRSILKKNSCKFTGL